MLSSKMDLTDELIIISLREQFQQGLQLFFNNTKEFNNLFAIIQVFKQKYNKPDQVVFLESFRINLQYLKENTYSINKFIFTTGFFNLQDKELLQDFIQFLNPIETKLYLRIEALEKEVLELKQKTTYVPPSIFELINQFFKLNADLYDDDTSSNE